MFGWRQALRTDFDSLYITEGEFDAVALWQIFYERGEYLAVVSLNGGVGSAVRNIRRLKEQNDRRSIAWCWCSIRMNQAKRRKTRPYSYCQQLV